MKYREMSYESIHPNKEIFIYSEEEVYIKSRNIVV